MNFEGTQWKTYVVQRNKSNALENTWICARKKWVSMTTVLSEKRLIFKERVSIGFKRKNVHDQPKMSQQQGQNRYQTKNVRMLTLCHPPHKSHSISVFFPTFFRFLSSKFIVRLLLLLILTFCHLVFAFAALCYFACHVCVCDFLKKVAVSVVAFNSVTKTIY